VFFKANLNYFSCYIDQGRDDEGGNCWGNFSLLVFAKNTDVACNFDLWGRAKWKKFCDVSLVTFFGGVITTMTT